MRACCTDSEYDKYIDKLRLSDLGYILLRGSTYNPSTNRSTCNSDGGCQTFPTSR